jgi:hypothetical protein
VGDGVTQWQEQLELEHLLSYSAIDPHAISSNSYSHAAQALPALESLSEETPNFTSSQPPLPGSA